MNINEYKSELITSINNEAIINMTNATTEFIKYYIDKMIDAEELVDFDDYDVQVVGKSRKLVKVDGFCYDSVDKSIKLFIADFSNNLEVSTLTNTAINDLFGRLEDFVELSLDNYILNHCEESGQSCQLSKTFNEYFEKILKIKLYILSENILSKQAKKIKSKELYGKVIEYQIWDIERIHNLELAGLEKEELVIDIKDFGYDGINCVLATQSEKEHYTSYLAVINGDLLAHLYLEYGARLLEGNVRSFLSVRGKVNKEIRRTIRSRPEIFFAYNNGIAATASEIEYVTTNSGYLITKLKNFQIINGGQTTASIANAVIQDKSDVSLINVAMKLSIVSSDKAVEMIPDIAKYANSQNKIDAADFFSNSPFHIRYEEMSRKIFAPAAHGNLQQTIWFYERARGQYTQEQMQMTAAEKNRFKMKNPKEQVIKKIDLAKYMVTYLQKPNIASKGNQFNMRIFASYVEQQWAKDSTVFNPFYYKKSVALAIIYKSCEKIISSESWYQKVKAYRANTVVYSISILFHYLEQNYKNYTLDFIRIWNEQELYVELKEQLRVLSYEVFLFINREDRPILNVTEWCKKEACWERAQREQWTFTDDFIATLISKNLENENQTYEKKEQKTLDFIKIQEQVINFGETYWKKVLQWGLDHKLLDEIQISFLKCACDFTKRIPTEKQCDVILKINIYLENEGMII